jgi:hypothetical protein
MPIRSKPLNEGGWLAARSPTRLLVYLRRDGKTSLTLAGRRRLRLFACSCCRRIDHLLPPEGRTAVEVAERFADGRAGKAELREIYAAAVRAQARAWQEAEALRRARAAADTTPLALATHRACLASAMLVSTRSISQVARMVAQYAAEALGEACTGGPAPAPAAEKRHQADLLRDLFGNPFRLPPVIDPSWRRWNDGTIPRLAGAIDEERAFDRLPVLADALEEAGCADADLLGHLRGPGPHARGCWALDRVLGQP